MSVEKICFGCADRDRVIEEMNVREMLLLKRIAEIEGPPPTYTSASTGSRYRCCPTCRAFMDADGYCDSCAEKACGNSAVLQPLDGVLPTGE